MIVIPNSGRSMISVNIMPMRLPSVDVAYMVPLLWPNVVIVFVLMVMT